MIQEISLTEDDILSESKEIIDLTPITVYKVTIYSGETSLESELYMTLAP